MAFKLTQAENTQRQKLVEETTVATNVIIVAREAAQAKINAAIAEVNVVIDAYNEVRGRVEAFRDDITSRLQAEYDEKSEKWQESERASSVQSLITEWENLDTNELDEQGELELSDAEPGLADDLEQLPTDATEL